MNKIRDLISDELTLLDRAFLDFFSLDTTMFNDLIDFLKGKSKRIRSLVCILYLKSQGININSKIIDLLFATELIHNASLLHDDVIDDSHIRRGVPNLYDKYGSKLSVISGDYILSVAVEKFLLLNNNKILNLFLDTVKMMSKAEITQFMLRNQEISLEQYLTVIKGKTASLFSACITSAAFMTDIDAQMAQKFGFNFGMLFQINNDMDSVSAKNDKINGVKTVVDILGIEKTLALKDNYKEELRQILTRIPDNKYKSGIEDLIKLL